MKAIDVEDVRESFARAGVRLVESFAVARDTMLLFGDTVVVAVGRLANFAAEFRHLNRGGRVDVYLVTDDQGETREVRRLVGGWRS